MGKWGAGGKVRRLLGQDWDSGSPASKPAQDSRHAHGHTNSRTEKLTNKHTELHINGRLDRQRQILAKTARTCSAASKAHLSLPVHLSSHFSLSVRLSSHLSLSLCTCLLTCLPLLSTPMARSPAPSSYIVTLQLDCVLTGQ